MASVRWLELDAIRGNDLALIQVCIVRFNHLPAQAALHYTDLIAALAIFENRCAMRPRVSYTGHSSLNVQPGSNPIKIARVKPSSLFVVNKSRYQSGNGNLAGKRRCERRVTWLMNVWCHYQFMHSL